MFKIPGSVGIQVVSLFLMIIIIIHMVFFPKHTYGLLYCLFKFHLFNDYITNYDDLDWKLCSV